MKIPDSFLELIRDRAAKEGVFGEIEIVTDRVACAAMQSAEPAFYRVVCEQGDCCVELVTEDRWLSESIEADLMHHGDPIEELIEEELAELD